MWQMQPASAPVLFNQGMAALFLGRAAEARSPLSRAVSHLLDNNGWYHLGKLYLALAEMTPGRQRGAPVTAKLEDSP
jgi:hypothetical protein